MIEKPSPIDPNPIAMIVDTQLGAGRKAFLNYTTRLSRQRRFYEIDPNLLLSDPDHLINFFTARRYDANLNQYVHHNVILHQDLTNPKEVDRVVTKLIDCGYTVGVRALATSYLDSKMSQIETNDFQRSVTPADYNMVPLTVNYLEETGKYDLIEIFKRGNEQRDYEPELVYAKFNPDTQAQTLAALADCENVSHRNHNYRFVNAQAALDKTRRMETIRCAASLPARIRAVEPSAVTNPVLHAHLTELKNHFAAYQQSCKLTKCVVHSMATAKQVDTTDRTI